MADKGQNKDNRAWRRVTAKAFTMWAVPYNRADLRGKVLDVEKSGAFALFSVESLAEQYCNESAFPREVVKVRVTIERVPDARRKERVAGDKAHDKARDKRRAT